MTAKPVNNKKTSATQGGLTFEIGSLQFEGDNRITFVDGSVSPPFKNALTLKKLELKQLSNHSGQKSPFTLQAGMGRYGAVDLKGRVAPFAKHLTMDLKGTLKAIDLPPFSPYSARSTGHHLSSGALDGDLHLAITQGALKGEADLTMHNMTLTKVDEKHWKALEKQKKNLDGGLNAKLDLLRDDNKDIRLKLPIRGTLEAPEVDPSDAIGQATARVMKSTAVTAIEIAAPPVGILLTAASLVGKLMDHLDLTPVPFAPGSDQLGEAAKKSLDDIGKALKGDKNLRLKLCGFGVEADRQALGKAKPPGDEALTALAKKRSALVKSTLIQSLGIEPARLFECRPGLDQDPKGAPRVEADK